MFTSPVCGVTLTLLGYFFFLLEVTNNTLVLVSANDDED